MFFSRPAVTRFSYLHSQHSSLRSATWLGAYQTGNSPVQHIINSSPFCRPHRRPHRPTYVGLPILPPPQRLSGSLAHPNSRVMSSACDVITCQSGTGMCTTVRDLERRLARDQLHRDRPVHGAARLGSPEKSSLRCGGAKTLSVVDAAPFRGREKNACEYDYWLEINMFKWG